MTVAAAAGDDHEKVDHRKCPLCMGDKVLQVPQKWELAEMWECPCCDLLEYACPHRGLMK